MKNDINKEFNHQKFLEIFRTLHSNPRKFKYHLKDSTLSLNERQILQAVYFYKKNKKQDCLALMKDKKFQSSFLEGVRLYLVGLTLNQFGHYYYALEHLQKSVSELESIPNGGFIVNPLSVLIIAHGNRREINKMGEYLDQLKSIDIQTQYQLVQRDYVELFYCVLTRRHEKALKLIEKYQLEAPEEFVAFASYFKIQEFIIYSHLKKYKECYRVLEEYKESPGHVVKENYLYMKSLLDLLVYEKPLYVYKDDFGENPELYHQLEVLKNLLSGNISEAKQFWSILAKHNPELYLQDFNFSGDETLFFQALEKYAPLKRKVLFTQDELSAFKSKTECLNYILEKSESPISAQELIMLIWNEEMNEKNLSRLRNLLYHYSKKHHKEVDCYQSAYSLKKKAS